MQQIHRMAGLCLTFFSLLVLSGLGLFGCQGGGGLDIPLIEQVQSRGKLIAGVKYDSKPFGYLDTDGKLKGYDIDLIRELARRILGDENAVEFQQVLSSTRVVALNANAVDVVAATMTITPEREKLIDFSEPYFIARQAVIVPKKSAIRSLDALNNKTVLFVLGTTSEKNIKKRLPEARYQGFKTSTDAFSALKAGRGDAMTTDDSILYGFMAESCDFRMLEERLSEEPYGLGIRGESNSREELTMRVLINRELEAMRADGTLEKLRQKWIKPADCPTEK